MTGRGSESGFTLVELLISAAILIVMLMALGGIYVSTHRAYETNRAVTASAGQLRSAIEALQYDLALAGYCVQEACSFGGTPLEVSTSVADGQRVVSEITAKYQETRYGAGSVISVGFRVEDERLLRSQGGSEVSIADGVSRLLLLGYRSSDDVNAARVFARPAAELISGIDLRLEYFQGGALRTEDFTVPLRNSL